MELVAVKTFSTHMVSQSDSKLLHLTSVPNDFKVDVDENATTVREILSEESN